MQTEGDAVRITQSMFGTLDMTDPVKLRNSLGNLMTDLGSSYKNNATLYEGRRKAYADNPTLNNGELVSRLTEGGLIFDRFSQIEEARKKAQAERSANQSTKGSQDRRSIFDSIWGN